MSFHGSQFLRLQHRKLKERRLREILNGSYFVKAIQPMPRQGWHAKRAGVSLLLQMEHVLITALSLSILTSQIISQLCQWCYLVFSILAKHNILILSHTTTANSCMVSTELTNHQYGICILCNKLCPDYVDVL